MGTAWAAAFVPKSDVQDPGHTDLEKCISCMRCVHICPHNARGVNPERLTMLREKLEKICQPDRENEFY